MTKRQQELLDRTVKRALIITAVFSLLIIMKLYYHQLAHHERPMKSSLNKTHFDDYVCKSKWPNLELFLTTPADEDGELEYSEWFLQSLALFWPTSQQLKLLIVTDKETPQAPAFAGRAESLAEKLIPNVQVRSVLTNPTPFPSDGWNKAQWLKMWADNFTNATYAGFVDTDTFFVTRITLNDLFIDNKPVVHAAYGKPRVGWGGDWSEVPSRTFNYTGLKEPFNCMTSFPVIVKTENLKTVREIIRQHVNATTFDEAFAPFILEEFYSEYNMMCAVMWWHFRDQYYWMITETDPSWEGPAPFGQVADLEEAEIPQKFINRTRPHLAVHWTYVSFRDEVNAIRNTLRQGYCYSLTKKEDHPPFCSFYQRNLELNRNEFIFEYDDFSQRADAFHEHMLRISVNERCPHDWNNRSVAGLSSNFFYVNFIPVEHAESGSEDMVDWHKELLKNNYERS